MSKTIKLLFLLIFPISLIAQNINQIFSEKNEIYFSFNTENKTQLDRLSKIISLDHKTNKIRAYAYANKKQFKKFLQKNIEFKIIDNSVRYDNISKNN